MTRRISSVSLVAILLFSAVPTGRTQGRMTVPDPGGIGSGSLVVTKKLTYTMTARIRPLLFWISRSGVGGGQIVWTESARGLRNVDLLIGSDPSRAPRRINRWGYITERASGDAFDILGVMTESDEQSLEQAETRLAQPGGTHAFKAIRGRFNAGRAESTVIHLLLADNLTYRDLGRLLERIPQTGAAIRSRQVPGGTEPGFLFALKKLIRESAQDFRCSEGAASRPNRRVFVYNATLYDLSQVSCQALPSVEVNGRSYRSAVEGRFEVRNRVTGETTYFSITYGIESPVAETPLRIVYRPRWWFEVELLLEPEADAAFDRECSSVPGARSK